MPIKVDKQALKKLRTDLLLAEYKARTDEITHLSTRYSSTMLSTGVIISVVLIVAGMGVNIPGGIYGTLKLSEEINPDLKRVLAIVLPAFILYMIASAMDALHLIMINGMRRTALEDSLNQLAGADLLVWDTHIYPQLFANINWLPRCAWIKPNLLQGFLLLVMTGAAFVSCGCGFASYFGWFSTGYWICLWAALFFICLQWGMLVTKAASVFGERHKAFTSKKENNENKRSPSCRP